MPNKIQVLGADWCPDCRRSKQFLSDQKVAFEYLNVEFDENAKREVERRNNGKMIIPVVIFADDTSLSEPSNADLAQKLGLEITASKSCYDLIVVGGGPAGLTTALYGAREGIDTLVLDKGALGGQASTTERVDNYPGFPEGISGSHLAELYVQHARRYGVEMLSGVEVRAITRQGENLCVDTDGGESYATKAVVLAVGSTYARLNVEGEDQLIGAGVHFCSTCDGPFYKGAQNIIVVGGGNSALEEGLFLTQFAKKITVIQNLETLSASRILQDRVFDDPRFDIRLSSKVAKFNSGDDGHLASIEIEHNGAHEIIEGDAAFIFIGLKPNTEFLKGVVELDERGFITTTDNLSSSMGGVFVAGDVRRGSTKQIASSVGEGAAALIMVRQYLESLGVLNRNSV